MPGDVIVVGGGIIGCAITQELARRGARVRLIEARTVAGGATQASAGILAPYIEGHERGALFDLTLRSLALYDDFVSTIASDATIAIDYRRCGSLEIPADDDAAAAMQQSAQEFAAAGLRLFILIKPAQIFIQPPSSNSLKQTGTTLAGRNKAPRKIYHRPLILSPVRIARCRMSRSHLSGRQKQTCFRGGLQR